MTGLHDPAPVEGAGPAEGERPGPELADVLDVPAFQSLLEQFYFFARIPMAIIDVKGKVLVGVGWQQICTGFHRVHPETCAHCIASDTHLTAGVPPGEFRLYKCKNNMWDVATPIMVSGRHVGNLFIGQFFFDGEPLDYDLFRAQARRYGFDEARYLAALEAVPRLSRDVLERGMSFFIKIAHMISQLSYSNLKLSSSLAERDALTQSLRLSQADLNRAQAVSHAGSWRLDVQRNVLHWSAEAYRIFGIPTGTALTYQTFLAAIHPEDRADVDRRWMAALRGEPYEVEHRILTGSGLKWVRERAELEFSPAGELLGGFGTVQDITESKKKEEELQKLNRTLKAHSHSNQAVMRATHEAAFMHEVCRIVVEDLGLSMAWIGIAEDDEDKTVRPVASAGIATSYLDALKITWADTERGRGPTGRAIRTGQPSMCRNMQTDPQFRPWREQAIKYGFSSSLVLPLSEGGKVFGALTIYSHEADPFTDDEVQLLSQLAIDLAYGIAALRLRAAHRRAEEALRQSEARYRELVELSPEAIIVNRADRIVFLNPAALELFGATEKTELLGKSPFELFHPESHAVIRERLRQLRDGQPAPMIEGKIMRLDGTARDVEVSAAPFSDAEGWAIQVILRDITERKQSEEALRRTAGELARSNQDLEQFAYVASHDLQEPLRMVTGFVELLREEHEGKLGPQADTYIKYAVDGARRMQILIDDLLTYSRVSTRGGDFEPTDAGEALEMALAALRAATAESGAAITHGPLPTVKADGRQLAQLFQNLVGNAIKFRAQAPPRIHVEARREEETWFFSVQDNGIGIDPAFKERIFLIFQRLHTRQKYPGTGIGLAICKKIVERHGGRIWLDAEATPGARFCFTIPA